MIITINDKYRAGFEQVQQMHAFETGEFLTLDEAAQHVVSRGFQQLVTETEAKLIGLVNERGKLDNG
jgi:hypothetical protein